MAYIVSELDELEREEFYRLKKIQDKKKVIRAKADKAAAERKKAGMEDESQNTIFDEHHDEDLLF